MYLFDQKSVLELFLIFAVVSEFTSSILQVTAQHEAENITPQITQEGFDINQPIPFGWNESSYLVELALVVDNGIFNALDKDIVKVEQRYKETINIVNSLFNQLNIFIALVRLDVWKDRNIVNITTDTNQIYYAFESYAKGLMKDEPINNVQLMSYNCYPTRATRSGIGKNAYGINCDSMSSIDNVVAKLAFCIANNMGVDDKNCSAYVCNRESQVTNWTWCPCVFKQMSELFQRNQAEWECLKNKPIELFNGPTCGNRFLEIDEECDCGLAEKCDVECCDAATCELKPNVPCRMGRN